SARWPRPAHERAARRSHARGRGPGHHRARRAVPARPARRDRPEVRLRRAGRAGGVRRRPAHRGAVGMSEASRLGVGRAPAHGVGAGVCAGFAARRGIDPLLIRIGFLISLVAGGVGIPLYIVGWLMIPAEGPERPVVARLLTRQDTWLVAAGMGCLV